MNTRQFSRPALMRHIKQFVSGKQAILLMRKTLFAIAIYEESAQQGVYDSWGNLKKRILAGSYVRCGAKQRRTIRKYYPTMKRGRPRKDETLILVSLLASAYVQVTGQPVIQYFRDQQRTAFEEFATPILDWAGILDAHGWITKHIQSRETT